MKKFMYVGLGLLVLFAVIIVGIAFFLSLRFEPAGSQNTAPVPTVAAVDPMPAPVDVPTVPAALVSNPEPTPVQPTSTPAPTLSPDQINDPHRDGFQRLRDMTPAEIDQWGPEYRERVEWALVNPDDVLSMVSFERSGIAFGGVTYCDHYYAGYLFPITSDFDAHVFRVGQAQISFDGGDWISPPEVDYTDSGDFPPLDRPGYPVSITDTFIVRGEHEGYDAIFVCDPEALKSLSP